MPVNQAPDVFNGQVSGERRISMLIQDIAYDKESSRLLLGDCKSSELG
jgi:hypothetical protein